MDKLFMTSANGGLYTYDLEENTIIRIAHINEWLMGIAISNDILYLGSSNSIFSSKIVSDNKIEPIKTTTLSDNNPSYHHMNIINNKLYVTAPDLNCIEIFDKDIEFIGRHTLSSGKAIFGNNHINSIILRNGLFYVSLNQLIEKFCMSGIAVLDDSFNEISRSEYGWQAHGFTIIDNVFYTLCNYTVDQPFKEAKCPIKGGLLVDNNIVFEYGNEWFCKDMSITNDYIIIVGGYQSNRKDRVVSEGIIMVLDREFNPVKFVTSRDTGELKGCWIKGEIS